jgi:RNA polymerase sigma-70 factor (ECF subfamily)
MRNELLEQLFKNKASIIYRYLLKIGCSHHDAEDIVQDAIFKALIYLEAIEEDKLGAWLFKVALNRYYDFCRKNKRHPLDSFDSENILHYLPVYHPEDQVLENEQKQQIARVLKELSGISQNLLILKYVVGLSYREAAEMLDINEQKAKTYIYRAKQKFRHHWRELNDE